MDEIKEMCRTHFNEPIISMGRVVRLIGYGETAVDRYLIVECPEKGIYWNTAVGGYTFLDRLKGQGYVKATNGEDWDDLFRLCEQLKYSGVPKREEFLLEIKPDDYEEDWCARVSGKA